MSNTTIALRSSGATGNVPNALSLAYGEFALNYADGIIYYRTDSNTVGSILTTQPSGLDTEIQFNDLGSFGSSANLSFNKTTGQLSTTRIYVAANAQIVGNVTANRLISNNSVGSSGGDILLAKPAANTTLSGLGITIDAFENKIRFYEQGGTNRGAYIDLTEAAANVGTNLLTAGGGGSGNNALQYRSSYTANGGQTVFAATYIPGYVDTFINGVKLTPDVDFTATNGTSITLSDAAVSNDSVDIIGYVTVSTTLPDAIQHRYSYTANSAQTTFAAVYVAPYIDVYKNGGRLSFGDDFIANNGTTVVLTTGAALDDLIEIVGYSSYTATVGQADQLTTGRTIGMTGDVTWTSNSFNGTANVTGTSTLANTGVTAGTYTKVTVDAKGRVTTGNTLSSSDIPTLNQNTTGNAATATTANNVSGGTANVTTLTTSSTVTLNGGTANGVSYLNASKVLTTGSGMTFDGTNFATTGSVTSAGLSDSGNLAFTGTGNRITGDFSNATVNNRVAFQTNVVNGATVVHAIPNGTSNSAFFETDNAADIGNSSHMQIGVDGTNSVRISSSIRGTGTLLPMTFNTGGSERVRIDTSGNVGIGSSSPAAHLQVYGAGTTSTSWTNGDASGAALLLQDSGTASGSGGQLLFGSAFGVHAGIKGLVTNGTGPAGELLFQTRATSGNVNERMRIDYLGNVGIGTGSPAAKLDVYTNTSTGFHYPIFLSAYNSASAKTNYLQLGFSVQQNLAGSETGGFDLKALRNNTPVYLANYGGAPGAAAWQFYTEGTERMRIDTSGNVGIGNIAPQAKLDLGAGSTGRRLNVYNDNTNAISGFGTDIAGGSYELSSYAGGNGANLGTFTWQAYNRTANTYAERMRIDSSGNLGIGVTSVSQKLHVAGNAQIGAVASTDAILYVNPGSGTKGRTGFTWYGATFGASWGGGDTSHRMVFRSGASNTGADAWTTMVYDIDSNQSDAISWVNRLRINGNTGDVLLGNNGGNLLVGTPTAIGGFTQITVVGSSTNRGSLQMGRTTAATTGVAGSLVAYNGSNTICGIDWQANGANNSGYIGTYTYNAGSFAQGPYLNTGGTNWTAASDERLKNVTGEIENALYKVSQIRAVEFTWKADTLNKQNIGFIAQDVQVVLPEVIDTDTNGNLGVRYAEVTALLLAAIKEQQVLINELKARLDAANM